MRVNQDRGDTLPRRAPPLSLVLGLALSLGGAPAALSGQDNVLDLRLLEANSDFDVTYQNFIYARSLGGGRFLAQALYLRIPAPDTADYNELAVGGGVRAAALGDLAVYLMASLARATDDNYLEPALLAQDALGRFTASLYLQHYAPLGDDGIDQWLIDSLEAQYAVRAPVSLGAALYAYRPAGGDWLTKIGPKVALADRLGSTELRATWRDGGGGHELQLRRIWIF